MASCGKHLAIEQQRGGVTGTYRCPSSCRPGPARGIVQLRSAPCVGGHAFSSDEEHFSVRQQRRSGTIAGGGEAAGVFETEGTTSARLDYYQAGAKKKQQSR